jgi:amino acid transporter
MATPWVTKSIADLTVEASDHSGLKQSINSTNLIMLGIGAVIGAGFFLLTGEAAARYAGPAISISFMLGGIVCAFAGLCYAEMASTVPVAGSAYTYAYATMGEFIAWLIGWDLILEYMVGATTVAINWSGYVASLIPLSIAGELTSIGTLFAFAVVSRGVLYLRITQPDIERPFKAPAIWFTAPMGVITAVLLMLTLPLDTWIRLVVWMVIGLVIYFLYGAHHSVLGAGKMSEEDGLAAPAAVK